MSTLRNNVSLIGRLVRDPELKKTKNGNSFLQFTIAVNRLKKDDKANFIDCVAFKGTAETIAKYFSKGKTIGILGELDQSYFSDSSGQNRSKISVVVNNFEFLDNGNKENNGNKKESNDSFPDFPETEIDDDDVPF